MYRGTTPTLKFTINAEVDLTAIEEVWITFNLSSEQITYTKDDVIIDPVDNTISLELSQEDTLRFNKREIEVQLRFLMDDGKAYASPIKNLVVNKILKNGVITAHE